MEDTETGPVDGAATTARAEGERVLAEVSVCISDMHLGEGARIKVRRRTRILGVSVGPRTDEWMDVPNVLEDFHADDVFAAFVSHLGTRFVEADVLRLRLLGDIFDPLQVRIDDTCRVKPTERNHVLQMCKIIDGHPAYFDALARFVRTRNGFLDVFTGNHDLFVVWKGVQRAILDRICGDDKELRKKVRFFDHLAGFRSIENGVLYDHMMNSEAHNACDPANAIITHRLGKRLKEPILNMPYGSYMTMDLVVPLKRFNALVGRMKNESDTWAHVFWTPKMWPWALFSPFVVFWHFVYSQFLAFWHFRMKAGVKMLFQSIFGTTKGNHENPVDGYARDLLTEGNGEYTVVVGAHSHGFRRESGPRGSYLNTGTWTQMFRLESDTPFAEKFTRFVAWAMLALALGVYLALTLPVEPLPWLAGLSLEDLKVPLGVLFGLVLLRLVLGFFVSSPKVVHASRYTFVLIRHYSNGDMKADTMEWFPDEESYKECV